jgi:hypothetical protein
MLMNVLNSLSDMTAEFEWLEPSLTRLSELMSDEELRKTGARTHLVNTHEPMLAGVTLVPADREFTKIISDVNDSLIQFFRSVLLPRSFFCATLFFTARFFFIKKKNLVISIFGMWIYVKR